MAYRRKAKTTQAIIITTASAPTTSPIAKLNKSIAAPKGPPPWDNIQPPEAANPRLLATSGVDNLDPDRGRARLFGRNTHPFHLEVTHTLLADDGLGTGNHRRRRR